MCIKKDSVSTVFSNEPCFIVFTIVLYIKFEWVLKLFYGLLISINEDTGWLPVIDPREAGRLISLL